MVRENRLRRINCTLCGRKSFTKRSCKAARCAALHARLSGLCVRILTLDVFFFAVQVYQEEGTCKYGCWRFKVVEEAEEAALPRLFV